MVYSDGVKIATKNSPVNHDHSSDFLDFLEKHLQFFIRYLMSISKYY